MPVKAPKPVPEGMNTVTTQLFFKGNCREAIEFYKSAFNASLAGNIAYSPDGSKVMHAMIKIGDTNLIMSDMFSENSESTPGNSSLFMYVQNCDAVFSQAVQSGCTIIHEMTDAFWGDRIGNLVDPFGYYWSIASYKWQLTPEEIAKGQEEWMKSMSS